MSTDITRRTILTGTAALLACGAATAAGAASPATAIPLTVHKDASCGCCGAWVEHLNRSGGFALTVRVESDMVAVKARLRVPDALASCHTSVAGGYVIEGHVPAADVRRLLRERPKGVVGIAVPGMPPGSPGMEVPGGGAAPYAVLAFDRNGRTSLFARHSAP